MEFQNEDRIKKPNTFQHKELFPFWHIKPGSSTDKKELVSLNVVHILLHI